MMRTSKVLTAIEDAVITVMKEIDPVHPSFGDLKFLLLSREVRRYPTKKKKRLYKRWEKKFKRENGWLYPLHSFDIQPSDLYYRLNKMEEKGIIIREGNGYRLTEDSLADRQRSLSISFLSAYPQEEIYAVKDSGVTVYGLNKCFLSYVDGVTKLKNVIFSKIRQIERVVEEINAMRIEIAEIRSVNILLEECKKFGDNEIMDYVTKYIYDLIDEVEFYVSGCVIHEDMVKKEMLTEHQVRQVINAMKHAGEEFGRCFGGGKTGEFLTFVIHDRLCDIQNRSDYLKGCISNMLDEYKRSFAGKNAES
ncbi:MAG: hypothetical protein J7L32_06205 [Thermoplasmata archaeon]|nr:hypothetical protein [Thermoplasmata archaeon]